MGDTWPRALAQLTALCEERELGEDVMANGDVQEIVVCPQLFRGLSPVVPR